jgi:hypothetical protein
MKVRFDFKNSFRVLCIFLFFASTSMPYDLRAQDYYEEDIKEDSINENTLSVTKDTEVCTSVLNQACCQTNAEACSACDQVDYEHWLCNRKMLLVAVPAVAGGIAVALAASSKHNVSYYTGSPYSCYGYDYDCYYYDSYNYSGSHSHHHSHYSGSYESHSDHVARFNSSVTVENITGSVQLLASLVAQDGKVLESSSLTVTAPGTFNFGKLEAESNHCIYQLHVHYILDGTSSIQGTLATVASFEGEEAAESTTFSALPNQSGEIIQTFNFCDE